MRNHPLLPVLAVLAVAGCGGEGGQGRAACPPAGDAGVAAATEHYIRQVEPRAHRFMYMAGTDSTLPEQARRVLQDRGPTYIYPADTAQQTTVRQRLAQTGGWTNLLVVLRGVNEPARRRAEVEMGGYYIQADGAEPAMSLTIPLECREGAWAVAGEQPSQRAS